MAQSKSAAAHLSSVRESEMSVATRYRIIHISDTRYVIPASETDGLGDIEVTTPEPDVTFFWGKAALEIAKKLAPIVIGAIADAISDSDGGSSGGGAGTGGGSKPCRPTTSIKVSPQGELTLEHTGCA